MKKTVPVIGAIVCGLCVLQCDMAVDIVFSPPVEEGEEGDVPEVGKCEEVFAPAVYNFVSGCEPRETVMLYPILDRKGITQVTIGRYGELLAKADDCRTYTLGGEAWRPNYSPAYWINELPEFIPDGEGGEYPNDWFNGQPGFVPNGEDYPEYYPWHWCVDIWYPEGLGENDTNQYGRSYVVAGEMWFFEPYFGEKNYDLRLPFETSVWGTSWSDYLETYIDRYVAAYNLSERDGHVSSEGKAGSEPPLAVGGGIRRYAYDAGEQAYMGGTLTYVPDIPFMDVFGNSVNDFFAVGNEIQAECPRVTGKVYHCNDSACELELSVPGAALKSIHGSSGCDLFVVGGNDERGTNGVIFQRKNGEWILRTDNPTYLPLNKVWAADANTAYAVGGAYDKDGVPSSVALRLSGDEWEILDLGSERPLYDVFGLSGDDVHIVGEEGFFHYGTERQNDWPALRAHDLCDMYNQMYDKCHLAESGDPIGVDVRTCETALLDAIAEGAVCATSTFSLFDCLLHRTCEEARPFFVDPTNPDAACAAEYAAVDCSSFPL